MCWSFVLIFSKAFLPVIYTKVNFLTKFHELRVTGDGRNNYVMKPGVHPNKVETKQMELGMHGVIQTTRIHMVRIACVG